MDFDWLLLVGAFGGGLFGAAIGALPAFAFTGVAVVVGVAISLAGGEYDWLGSVAFGPVLGPHVAFAGGVAAAAYAARRDEIDDGTDIITPLAGLSTPDVLLVGGAFGSLGYVLQWALANLIGDFTDVVALVVVLSGVAARFAFGRTGLLGRVSDEAHTGGRFDPSENVSWVPYQQSWAQAAVLGLGAGLFSSFLALTILDANPDATLAAQVAGFGVSAASLLFLAFGLSCPVTHHMSIVAAYAAVAVGNEVGGILLGAAAGVVAALVGELSSRLFLLHGDSHIDPPAMAIWVLAVPIFVVEALVGRA